MPAPKRVKVTVYSGKNLKGKKGDEPLAWVVFGFGKDKRCTKQKKDKCPSWNEEAEFTIVDHKLPLKLTVKDKDSVLGQIVLPLTDLPTEEHCLKWVRLEPHRKNLSPVGEICVDCWIDEYYGDDDDIPKKSTTNLNLKHVMGRLSHNHILRRSSEDISSKKNKFSISSGGKSMKGSVSMEFLAFGGSKRRDLADWNEPKSKIEEKVSPKQPNLSSTPPNVSIFVTKPSPVHSRSRPNDLATVSEHSSPPEIDTITPKHGPVSGGTLIQITGKNLGRSAEDIITLRIGNSNCLPTLEYYSPEKLMCTTVAGEGLSPVVLTTKSGGFCTSKLKFHFRRSESAPGEQRKEQSILGPSNGLKEFRRQSMADMEEDETNNMPIDDTDYYDPDEKNLSCSSDEDPKVDQSEVEKLKSQVESLQRQNKDLRGYLDRLIVYLMEKYPDALESRRMYRF